MEGTRNIKFLLDIVRDKNDKGIGGGERKRDDPHRARKFFQADFRIQLARPVDINFLKKFMNRKRSLVIHGFGVDAQIMKS